MILKKVIFMRVLENLDCNCMVSMPALAGFSKLCIRKCCPVSIAVVHDAWIMKESFLPDRLIHNHTSRRPMW